MTQQDSGTNGIGNDDLDQDGLADATQDQSETGGSGGAGLTRNEGEGAPDRGVPAKPLHGSTESGAVGAEDTRFEQAGRTALGSEETGANQAPDDLAPAT